MPGQDTGDAYGSRRVVFKDGRFSHYVKATEIREKNYHYSSSLVGTQLYPRGEDVWICDGFSLQKNGSTQNIPEYNGDAWVPKALVETENGLCVLLRCHKGDTASGLLAPVYADGKAAISPENGTKLPEELSDAEPCCAPETGLLCAKGMLWRSTGEGFSFVADLAAYGVIPSNLRRVLTTDTGSIVCLQTNAIILLTPLQAGETATHSESPGQPAQRETLLVGACGSYKYPTLADFVSYVNLHGTDFRLELKYYEDEEQLNRALLTGELDLIASPDLFGLKRYGTRGLLQDLEATAPEPFRSGLLYEAMVDALGVDGSCYCLPAYITPAAPMLPRRYEVNPDTLRSFADFVAMLEKKDPDHFGTNTRISAFNNWFLQTFDHWLDPARGIARFDTEEFIEVLKFCARFPTSPEEAAANSSRAYGSGEAQFQYDLTVFSHSSQWASYLPFRLPYSELSTVALDTEFYLAAVKETDPAHVRSLVETILTDEGWHDFAQYYSTSISGRYPIYLNRKWTENDLDAAARATANSEYHGVGFDKNKNQIYVEITRQLFEEANHFRGYYPVMDVIHEEVEVFFNDDCTAEEAARRI